jgi:hypothetical protein
LTNNVGSHRHVTKKPQNVCGEGTSKNVLLKCNDSTWKTLIRLNVFNKDRHMAKSLDIEKLRNTHREEGGGLADL